MRKALVMMVGVILIPLLTACNRTNISEGNSANQPAAQNSPPEPPPATGDQTSPAAQPAPSASGQGNDRGPAAQASRYSTAQIDQMVAPVALYPDALMTQILMASAYPYDVADADRWVQANRGLSGRNLDDALSTAGWDPSVIALCKFPNALERMGRDIQWTTDMGYAFLNQRDEVMSSVQRLRQEAYRNGHLRTSSQVRVVVEAQYIVIQPYTPNVYYAPYYNPTIVYGAAWNYPNYYYQSVWTPSPGYVMVNGFAWGAGFAFGGVLFGGYDWNHHNAYINNTVFYNNSIYRNTDYYRNRSTYGGQAHRDWAYNSNYHQRNEGFVRAPYAGRQHGEVRGMPEGSVRGEARDPGSVAGNPRGQGQQHPGGPGHGQGQGVGQGPGPHPGGQGNGHGQGMGQGQHSGGQGQSHGQDMDQGHGQGDGKHGKQGTGQSRGEGKNKKQESGQGHGKNKK